ncbi:peptidyl-prolyl cis-trans isomerase [Guyparkeria hydrothermalis]|uniref:peptidylprolyl isomerase n=1 Tax=Guyparkeria hydrothermalis TaxID=923 RepID=UPI0020208F21|nr:peptidylprolyl isomerase [Guyparkeria hydrothermalis]MCL7745116.1 peptidyl-prolyl cis-trans isomerase [Guyparkeria hydrothermalis]
MAMAETQVRIETNQGPILVELFDERAPATVDNFLTYVRDGFYDGTIFHRVIPDFVAQGGGFTADFTRKETRPPVKNEADNGIGNTRGTLAMARTADPDSATAQFFINLADNDFLDRRDDSAAGAGYTVFGEVIEGMETVDRIANLPTGAAGPFRKDVPRETVRIDSVQIVQTAD